MIKEPTGRKPSQRQTDIREVIITALISGDRDSSELIKLCEHQFGADDNEVRRALRSLKKSGAIITVGRKKILVGGNAPYIWRINNE